MTAHAVERCSCCGKVASKCRHRTLHRQNALIEMRRRMRDASTAAEGAEIALEYLEAAGRECRWCAPDSVSMRLSVFEDVRIVLDEVGR